MTQYNEEFTSSTTILISIFIVISQIVSQATERKRKVNIIVVIINKRIKKIE